MSTDSILIQPTTGVEQHFWVASYPFFESSLFVIGGNANENLPATKLQFFDADGELFNEVNAEFEANTIGVLELDQFMGACKLEGGMKHAHISIKADMQRKFMCRFHTKEGAAFIGQPAPLWSGRSVFFPLTLAHDRAGLLALVNYGAQAVNIRGRFYCGKRSPESTWTIPANGCRVVDILAEFDEFIDLDEGEQLQSYLRVSTRSEWFIGAQVIERLDGTKDSGIFTAVN